MTIREYFRSFSLYQCDVLDCNNRVYSLGAICPECIEKMTNDCWYINYCVKCGKIINFFDDIGSNFEVESKINATVCKFCDTWILDELY